MRNIYTKVPPSLRWRYLYSSLVLLLLTLNVGNLQGQVSAYTFSQSNGTFNSIAATGTVVPGSEATTSTTNDTAGWTVTMPFGFNFNGNTYTSINIMSDGAATFGTSTSSSSTMISDTGSYSGAIGVMNRDLWGAYITAGVTTAGSNVITNVVSMQGIEVGKLLATGTGIPANTTVTGFDEAAGTITMSNNATSGSTSAVVRYGIGKVYTSVEGTAPNRIFVIEWNGYNDYGTGVTASNRLSFQLRLAETSNIISTVYGPSYNISTTSRTNQIGLRGATNSDYNNRTGAVANPWTATAAGTSNSATVARNNTNYPAAGLTFTWTPPACFIPAGPFNYGALSTNSVNLSWTVSNIMPANGYDIYYSTANTAPTTATVLDATNSVSVPPGSPSATISGLSTATQYFVWVRSRCSTTDFTQWVAAGSITTLCNPFTVPYSENFDSTAAGTSTNNNAPNCWKYLEPAGWPGYGYVYSTANFSAPNSYYIYSTNTTGGGMLVSPPTTNLMNGLNRVRFMASAGGANYFIEVGTLSDPNDPATFTAIGSPINLGPTSSAWDEYSVYIPAGTNQYLAFRHPGQTGSGTSVRVDDIFVEVTPACDRPDNLAVTGFTANSVSLAWAAPVVTSPQNYTVYYSTSNVAPTASTVLDVNNSLTVSGLSATVPALNANTTYYFWVRSNCAGSDVSTWTNTVVSGYTGYCIPATGTTTTRYVETVTTTGGMTNLNYSASSYTPYVDQSANTFSTYPSGTINYSIDASTTSSTYYYIWVDWNNDLDFEDAGEKVLGTGSVATAVGALTIPSTTPLGTYRVRVAAATASTIGACGTPANGSYVDFTLVVVAPTGCIAPSNFTVSNETSNTAQVSWTASVTPPANGYEVYYSTVNTAPTAATILDASNSVASTTTSATVSGLAPSTVYYIWIRSKCSGSDFSVWSGGISFTTLCAAVPAPFTESFSTGVIPACWTNANPTTTSTNAAVFWKFSGMADYGANLANNGRAAGTFAWVDASSPYANEHTVQLLTPLINLTGLTAPFVQFDWFKNHSTSTGTTVSPSTYDNNKLTVEVNDGTGWAVIFTSTTNASTWRTEGIALSPSYLNATIQLRFTVDKDVAGNGYFYDDVLLDEIQVKNDPSLSTAEVKAEREVSVYPNPFTDLVNISDVKDLKSVSVIDMSGRLVKTIANPGRQINLSELKSGLYILKLDYKDGTAKTVKAVKK